MRHEAIPPWIGPPEWILSFVTWDISALGTVWVAAFVVLSAGYGIAAGAARATGATGSSEASGATDRSDGRMAGADEFVHPTDRVLRHLRRNDDRMSQQALVEEMDRSPASVSRHLSTLEDADRVRRIRVGNHNVVLLGDGGRIPRSAGDR